MTPLGLHRFQFAFTIGWWLPGLALALGYSYFIYTRMPKKFEADGSEH
jgi:hypothetical protein